MPCNTCPLLVELPNGEELTASGRFTDLEQLIGQADICQFHIACVRNVEPVGHCIRRAFSGQGYRCALFLGRYTLPTMACSVEDASG